MRTNELEKGVTVILCTYNGAQRLPETIAHLAAQVINHGVKWEVIFIDNASSDNSAAAASAEWEKHKVEDVGFKIVTESTPGKLFAFQKGIKLAKYEYFIICDDDNWLNPDYLNMAYDVLEKNPDIGAVGGQTIAVTEDNIPLPDWFETFKEGYAIGQQAAKTGDISSRGHLWGAGLTSRTSLYIEAYHELPSILLTSKDQKILSTEDTEYCLRLVLKGYQLYYDSRLTLKHFIPKARLTLAYKDGLYKNFANAHNLLERYYLSIKFGRNNKLNIADKIRLTVVTPFRFVFASSKEKRTKQRVILSYLLPAMFKADPITAKIRTFIMND
jgi:glycosyltransferase involved in cell wall biosynthesis